MEALITASRQTQPGSSRVKLACQLVSYVAGGSGDERANHLQEASTRGASYGRVGLAYWRHPGFASVICMRPIRRSVKPASQ